ncbi:HAD family hydrolase [Alicyclobacillus dauci]|uniref:HAD family hydrolase n=1 Tax=Alicyclobacillus dauci TaxID=1475485 RepID=A0ABY6Z1D9_9BACL|nr:HAD family hydrolase [Alicyclobacillus dauci]WAH36713.1 HAD family hydrolase [Alicyclobacillus dauci]
MAVLIFDLDGTLIDTGQLAISAYRRVLINYGYTPDELPTDEQILKTFGLPDTEIWSTLMAKHSDPALHRLAFRESGDLIYADMEQNAVLLPHARDVLVALKRQGHTLTTASNCGQQYLDAVLDTQGIREFFDSPLCLETVKGTKKSDILREHLTRYDREDCVMIGDRSTDRDAAVEVDMAFIGCNFGFGDRTELAGAECIIQSLPELVQYMSNR